MVERKGWSLFTSHGVVLLHLVAAPDSTLRSLSDATGLTERHVARVVKDLAEAGVLEVQRRGRRNSYAVNGDAPFQHPLLSGVPLRRLLEAISGPGRGRDGA